MIEVLLCCRSRLAMYLKLFCDGIFIVFQSNKISAVVQGADVKVANSTSLVNVLFEDFPALRIQ